MAVVSVIIPCYNEEATICLLLDALRRQTYPCQDMEVIISDGLSTDCTRERIRTFQNEHPELNVIVVDNHKRTIPSGLNCAIAAASGQYIVRLDAHSVPREDYVARCVAALEEGLGENVGGVWEIVPGQKTWIARSIAAAAANPLGVGDARYRYTERAQRVDTVPFGAFRRELVDQIGGFDETLLTNEDYEFNVRIRKAQGNIWLDPAIRTTYFARASLPALAHQYWRYGFWKAQMLRRYPDTIRWRQGLPPLFVLSIVLLSFNALWLPAARVALAVELGIYLSVLLAAAGREVFRRKEMVLLPGIPLAIATMHIAWGTAFLISTIKILVQKTTKLSKMTGL